MEGSADYDLFNRILWQMRGQVRYAVQCCGFTVEYIQYDWNGRNERQWRFNLELANVGSIGNFNGAGVNTSQGLGGLPVRLLVTGAGGFVGGHLVDFLHAEEPGVEIHGVVLPHGGVSWRAAAGARVVEADLNDPAAAAAVVEEVRPERILHLAGQSSVHLSWLDPGGTMRTNVLGIVHLLDAVRRQGCGRRCSWWAAPRSTARSRPRRCRSGRRRRCVPPRPTR